jgi:hypothetical protein
VEVARKRNKSFSSPASFIAFRFIALGVSSAGELEEDYAQGEHAQGGRSAASHDPKRCIKGLRAENH